jgi:hypothetical protein
MLKLACLIALAMFDQLAFSQDQVSENDPTSASEERWNAYGQFTTIVQKKNAFHAAYTK